MTETKYHFVSLCLVRTHQGATHWVKAPAYKVNVGDLVSFEPGYSPNPSIGTVEECAIIPDCDDTYRMIAHAYTIYEAQRIFSPMWEKEEADGNEP